MSKKRSEYDTPHAQALKGASEYRTIEVRPQRATAKEPAPERNPLRWVSRLEQAQGKGRPCV